MAEAPLRRLFGGGICSRCLTRAARSSPQSTSFRYTLQPSRRLHGSLVSDRIEQRHSTVAQQGFVQDYFSANSSIDRGWLQNSLLAVVRTNAESTTKTTLNQRSESNDSSIEYIRPAEATAFTTTTQDAGSQQMPPKAVQDTPESSGEDLLPHRRRKRRKESDVPPAAAPPGSNDSLPLDASSQLTTTATSLPSTATLRRRFATYLALTKPRLSFLILLSTTSAYSLYPIPEILSTTATADFPTTLSTSTLTLLFLTTGTFLSCASANTLNMLFEPRYDALMTRTRNRPIVRNLISPRAAAVFAFFCGATGLTLLYYGANPTVAGLSALNIFLYAGVYTPMKRISAVNTWVGAIVGGIPPLMGWCAAAGQAATTEHHSWQDLLLSEESVGGWLLAALLFAWQFPHFMSLSHTIRDDYKNAGHKMLAWTNPARNARVALRYSIAMFPICAGLYAAGIVNQGFLAISTVCNVWMTREAVRFWQKQGAGGTARGLFWASVWQLPLVLVGALICKARIWDGVFGGGEEPVSVYEEDATQEMVSEKDGQTLGMEEKHRRFNMAMMGFKRPS
ncbi:protoheme IX farnesyltransferase [Cyphellophora europaea CBS 101466]|uniref:Protoheme IX farnesyltransferase, mitochondrial n=1 Tax=Cyphellophora europaea (strain CBS 101466) TaxID=1220924 RepID=W2RQ59_CYPE1|nr:protoheme IX farnesyltransferase [Cyphellophora europaea CBS 101466]ETN38430.1 protoheme IX farnesyltransferase [Cyphellophora europaea CBS 101466]